MTILSDKTFYIVSRSNNYGRTDKTCQAMNDVYITLIESDEGDKFEIVEFNTVEGYSRDVTEDVYSNHLEKKFGTHEFKDGAIIREMSDADRAYFDREFAMQKGS